MTQTIGRKKLSPQEKAKRQEFLKNEPITARTKRVLNPLVKNNLRTLDRLISAVKSSRYYLDEKQKEKLMSEITKRVDSLINALTETNKQEVGDIL